MCPPRLPRAVISIEDSRRLTIYRASIIRDIRARRRRATIRSNSSLISNEGEAGKNRRRKTPRQSWSELERLQLERYIYEENDQLISRATRRRRRLLSPRRRDRRSHALFISREVPYSFTIYWFVISTRRLRTSLRTCATSNRERVHDIILTLICTCTCVDACVSRDSRPLALLYIVVTWRRRRSAIPVYAYV